jgi:membrane protein DedA with SNARE-associated domain
VEQGAGLSRRALTLVLVPVIAQSVAGTVANAVFPTLLANAPLLLIAIQPRFRYLVATATVISPVPFFLVALAGKLFTDPLYFLLGQRYGDRAVRWMEQKLGAGDYVVTVERWFKKADNLIVFLSPSGLVSTLAGATGMSWRRFLALDLAGSLAAITFVRLLGGVFEGPINSFIRFNERYMWWLTGISILAVAISVGLQQRRGTSDIESIAEAERELEGEEPG